MAEFKLPELGENIASADIVSVLVNEGDVIKAQQDVIEIETDKAVIAVPSDVAGKVTKIHVARGQAVKPGQVILNIDAAAGGSSPRAKSSAGSAKQSAPPKGSSAASKTPAAKPAASSTAPHATAATPKSA